MHVRHVRSNQPESARAGHTLTVHDCSQQEESRVRNDIQNSHQESERDLSPSCSDRNNNDNKQSRQANIPRTSWKQLPPPRSSSSQLPPQLLWRLPAAACAERPGCVAPPVALWPCTSAVHVITVPEALKLHSVEYDRSPIHLHHEAPRWWHSLVIISC